MTLAPFGKPPVTVAPLFGRAVLFRSDVMLHGTEPARHGRPRRMFTVWVDGLDVNGPDDVSLRRRHLDAWRGDGAAAAAALAGSPLARAVSRAVYAEAYEASVRRCFGAAGEAAAEGPPPPPPRELLVVLATHRAHVRAASASPDLGPLVAALRERVADAGPPEAVGAGHVVDLAPAPFRIPPLAPGRRRLYLCRHGETDWNAAGRMQGRSDVPLNATGAAQAAVLGAWLAAAGVRPALVASSTLCRAAATADAVAAAVGVDARRRLAGFDEMCFGDMEGKQLVDDGVGDEYRRIREAWAAGDSTLPSGAGGECPDDVVLRATAALEQLGYAATGGDADAPEHVVVCAHGRLNKILIAALVPGLAVVEQGNTCVNVLDFDPAAAPDEEGRGGWTAAALNITEHLRER